MNNPLVSVIIPTYNRESCIERAITSVLNQTYSNLEIIVVDDCSSDKTIDVIQGIHDSRIKCLINDENRGACYSRNRGVDASVGEIVAFQDSDDVWVPNKLERNLYYMNKEEADVVFSSYVLNESIIRPNVNLNDSSDKLKTLLLNTCIGTPTLVMKRTVFEAERFDEGLPRFQDYDLSIRLAKKYNLFFIPEVLVKAYASQDGITKNSKAAVVALEKIYDKHKEIIDSDRDVCYEFNLKLGKYTEESGQKGSVYFAKAKNAKCNAKACIEHFLSVVRLYTFIYRIYDSLRKNKY